MQNPTVARSPSSFRTPGRSLGNLGADTVGRIVSAAADIAVIVDRRGIVRDVAFGSDELLADGFSNWVGQPWVQTVTLESREKIEDLLSQHSVDGVSRWRQVNHASAAGADVPVRYSAVRLGDTDSIVAIGRDLRPIAVLQQRLVDAQQSMEREYARLRQVETRYRMLFQVSSEAVLIVDGDSGRILDGNPAAALLLGIPIKQLAGRAFSKLFGGDSRQKVQRGLDHARVSGSADQIGVRAEGRNSELVMACSVFRENAKTHYLVRLASTDPEQAAWLDQRSNVFDVLQKMPDGFVVTDGDQRILTANASFLAMTQIATEDQLRGEPIDRWIGRHPVEASVLVKSVREHGEVRGFATRIRGELGSMTEVHVSGVAVSSGDVPCLGFTIHRVERAQRLEASFGTVKSVDRLTELVGQVSLKKLVQDSTDLIERLCIEAALELTGDNRSSAAGLLGLSRQGLYSKLRRHGLGDL